MNQVQLPASIMSLISFAAGLFAGRGLFGWDTATWTAVLGAVAGLAVTISTAFMTRKSAIVTTVANLPEVKSVAVEATPEGRALAAPGVTPSNVQVVQ